MYWWFSWSKRADNLSQVVSRKPGKIHRLLLSWKRIVRTDGCWTGHFPRRQPYFSPAACQPLQSVRKRGPRALVAFLELAVLLGYTKVSAWKVESWTCILSEQYIRLVWERIKIFHTASQACLFIGCIFRRYIFFATRQERQYEIQIPVGVLSSGSVLFSTQANSDISGHLGFQKKILVKNMYLSNVPTAEGYCHQPFSFIEQCGFCQPRRARGNEFGFWDDLVGLT